MNRMDREFSDYKKIGLHLNQLVGSSSSIGARRVRNVCVAFRSASELSNRPGYKLNELYIYIYIYIYIYTSLY